ncbi:hypothetical protein CcaCcLH18_10935 [Colletotrichum camelliae]|nr:hypothetical protein CcaCcLH18_10935 [Colletotrichum camelliae]
MRVGAAAPATSATPDTLNSDWSVVTGPILHPFHANRHNLFTLHDKQRRQCQLPQTATTTKNTTNPPMLGTCTILDWLRTLPPTPQGQPDLDDRRSRKRKRSSNFPPPYHLPSPPFDQDTMNPREIGTSPDTPLRKSAPRLSPNEDAAEVDVETPRGPRVDPLQVARQTAQSDTSSIASSISEQTSMSEQALSEQTSSTSKKRKRQSSPRKQSNLITIQNAMNHRSFEGEISPPPALGHLLDTIETLARGIGIVSPAKEASVRAEAKASTSRQFRWVRDETFAGDPSDGAILPKYTRSGKSAYHNKKVDFCVYVKEQSEELDAAIIPSEAESINHTDHSGLVRSPIGLSIETKITSHDWVNAVNQITVWLIAQWDSLDDFASGGQPVRLGFSPAAAAGLSFLPGIIVQGHEWWFIAVGRKPNGSTEL